MNRQKNRQNNNPPAEKQNNCRTRNNHFEQGMAAKPQRNPLRDSERQKKRFIAGNLQEPQKIGGTKNPGKKTKAIYAEPQMAKANKRFRNTNKKSIFENNQLFG